ncbi:inositol monophosphatase family protein [Actinoallomurus sp. CA-142502]|uniref:inositol monophosphatase family protein n=1 Tax=Actinoallomurus sp. CA-142502 TaxID=3239885 RepID=UPI003D89F75D
MTETDKNIGSHLVAILEKEFSGTCAASEDIETGNTKNKSDALWKIDPIDGTINFSRGIPLYSVSVALERQGQPVLAAVYDPFDNVILIATSDRRLISYNRDSRSFIRNAPTRPNVRDVNSSLISVMITPKMSTHARALSYALIEHSVRHTLGVRILVSHALEATYLARQRLDAVVVLEGKDGWTWSTAALFARASGGRAFSISDRKTGRPGLLLSSRSKLAEFLTEWLETVDLKCLEER